MVPQPHSVCAVAYERMASALTHQCVETVSGRVRVYLHGSDVTHNWQRAIERRRPAQSEFVCVEIHADDMSVNLAWDGVSGSPGAPACPAVLGLCTLTLSGEVDWGVLEVVRTFMRERWAAAEYDEKAGLPWVEPDLGIMRALLRDA